LAHKLARPRTTGIIHQDFDGAVLAFDRIDRSLAGFKIREIPGFDAGAAAMPLNLGDGLRQWLGATSGAYDCCSFSGELYRNGAAEATSSP
jgi:hypothetical protein